MKTSYLLYRKLVPEGTGKIFYAIFKPKKSFFHNNFEKVEKYRFTKSLTQYAKSENHLETIAYSKTFFSLDSSLGNKNNLASDQKYSH